MSFKFSLESLLRHRRALEDRERLALQLINRGIVQLRNSLNELSDEIASHAQCRQTELAHGVHASQLQFLDECDSLLKHRVAVLHVQLQQAEDQRAHQQAVLAKAQRAREVLESIRDGQLRAFLRQLNRREQQSLDELVLMRHGTGKG